MKQMPQELRKQTLELVKASGPIAQLIEAWLGSLDDEDLADLSPGSLAPVLVEGFTQLAKRTGSGCQIAKLQYEEARGGHATALLIVNDDMCRTATPT